ncbi:hypothetical protein C5S36_04595, partial [Candidatus Methanophagaceae archaeon]
KEVRTEKVDISEGKGKILKRSSNPTDWKTVLEHGVKKLLE